MANAVAMKNLDNLNNYVDEINKYIKDFEDGIITDFNDLKNCIIKTMNNYIYRHSFLC